MPVGLGGWLAGAALTRRAAAKAATPLTTDPSPATRVPRAEITTQSCPARSAGAAATSEVGDGATVNVTVGVAAGALVKGCVVAGEPSGDVASIGGVAP